MHVLCIVLVMVYVGQTCQGALVYQRPTYPLRHTLPGSAKSKPGAPAAYHVHRSKNINDLQNYFRIVYKNGGRKHKQTSERGSGLNSSTESALRNLVSLSAVSAVRDTPGERRSSLADSVSASVKTGKSSVVPHLPPHSSLKEVRTRNATRQHSRRRMRPKNAHTTPITVTPEAMPFRKVENIATAPPNVCDLCPTEEGKNPLDPCTCEGVGGSSAGLISISCPSSIVSLDQLHDIFHNTNFLTTHVFQFSLQGSKADGALTRDIWGNLDFKYVSINYNKITDVDNGAFIGSTDTLISLDLANNQIRNYIALYNNLTKLQSLNLRGNNISIIYSEDFKYPLLTNLDISYNQITSIGIHSFAGLKKLMSLDLSYNLLTSIGDERFTFVDHDFSNTLVINLSNNKISYLSDKAFLCLHSVEIDLRYNQLHTLQENIFSPIITDSKYYAFFFFSGNEMVCDCRVMWAVEDANTTLCFDNFLCTNNNKYFHSLEVSDLGNCSRKLRNP